MAHAALWTSLILSCAILTHYTEAQKCVPAQAGLTITEQAYRTAIIVKAKVLKPGKVNHTAQVTEVFATRNGGLSKGSNIVFGPVKKAKGCTKIKKNGQYILFLELPDSSEPNYYRIQFDPVSKLSQAKKLKKFLCRGCVKPPKISGKSKKVTLKENGKYTFKCKASGNPKPMATFLKDGQPLPKKPKGMKIKIKKKGGGGKLMLTKVKKEHEGVYTCQVESFVGNASLSITVTVLKGEPPTTPPPPVSTSDDCTPCPARDSSLCVHGRCCYLSIVNQSACRCHPGFNGKRCRNPIIKVGETKGSDKNAVEARYQQQTVAIMAVCIALLFIILICYFVYCKFKKSRSEIRKELIARNGHAGSGTSDGVNGQPISAVRPAGILGDDEESSNIHMTGYHSTEFTASAPLPNQSQQPTAFSQRLQTYDEVILPKQASESQPFLHAVEPVGYGRPRDGSRQERNGRRRRKNGVAVGHTDDHSRSESDATTPKASRRVDEIKTGAHDSMTSSASSLASHDPRKPALPIDDRVVNMIALSRVHNPPAYPAENRGDVSESSTYQPSAQESMYHSRQGSPGPPHAHVVPSPSSPSSASSHRVTTFDCDGKVEEVMMERDEGDLQDVTPHSPNMSPDFYDNQYLPSTDQNLPSPSLAFTGTDNSEVSQRPKLHYQNKNIGGIYPYHERSQDHPRTPSTSCHDTGDLSSAVNIPDSSSQMHDNPVRGYPSSPIQYMTGTDLELEVPYRHAPITVASARTHHLPLLTKEHPELSHAGEGAKLLAGSNVSLSSSQSNTSSVEAETNRNSHKIEV